MVICTPTQHMCRKMTRSTRDILLRSRRIFEQTRQTEDATTRCMRVWVDAVISGAWCKATCKMWGDRRDHTGINEVSRVVHDSRVAGQ